MSSFIHRLQYASLAEAMQTRRVVFLHGVRQCGKTTLAKQWSQNGSYRTLDDATFLDAARIDPQGFVQHQHECMVIDEVQRVPSLIMSIKKVVDENSRCGQFLITGSADIYALPHVQESLAGRIQRVRLRTLTQTEVLSHHSFILDAFFQQEWTSLSFKETKADILSYCFRGGYPEAMMLSQRRRRRWYADYINVLLEKDARDIIGLRRQDELKNLMIVACSWSSKLMDMSRLGTKLSLNRNTLESYWRVLEAMFLVDRLPPWTKTDYQRVGRQSKIFVNDAGIVCSLLKWKEDDVLLDSDRSGKIVETFLYNELAVQVDAANGLYELYHYRDREGREVDFIVEREDGCLLGIEVKAGSSVGKQDFRHLTWMRDHLVPDKFCAGVVLYMGEQVVPFGDRLWAVPIGHLWHS